MTNKNLRLSIIVPAYKEAELIGKSLDALSRFLNDNRLLVSTEVIVVAADAGDGTAEIARSKTSSFPHFTVIEPGPRVGKGRDVGVGYKQAKAPAVLFMDADLATPLHHILTALKEFDEGAEVVIGVRDLNTIHKDLKRRLSSRASNLVINKWAVSGVKDTQCGFKLVSNQLAKKYIEVQTVLGWGFDFELLALAQKQGLQIKTIEIVDWQDPKGEAGLSGDSQWLAMKATLKELRKVKKNRRKGLYS